MTPVLRIPVRRSHRRPVRILALGVVVLVTACVPPPVPEAGAPTDTGTTTTATSEPGATTGPGSDGSVDAVVEAARVSIGQPAVQVVEQALDAARRIDFIRHDVPRGERRETTVVEAREVVDALMSSLAQLDAAVDALPETLEEVRRRGSELSQEARAVAAEVTRELDGIQPYVQLDRDTDAVVAAWSQRGSRSEFEARLTALVVDAEAVVGRARRLRTSPVGCPGPRTNRIRWAEVVLERTETLLEVAQARAGTTYDQLRDRYGRAPVGEDRVTADAESRPCWAERTGLLTAPQTLQDRLSDLEDALRG